MFSTSYVLSERMASSEAELKEVRKALRATQDERDAAHQELADAKAALKATGITDGDIMTERAG
jgi:septal ring factor EnvC (AmiA/AmiB activator)